MLDTTKSNILAGDQSYTVPTPDKPFVPPTIAGDGPPDTKAGKAPADNTAWLQNAQDTFEAANLATHTPAPKNDNPDDTSTWRGGNTGE